MATFQIERPTLQYIPIWNISVARYAYGPANTDFFPMENSSGSRITAFYTTAASLYLTAWTWFISDAFIPLVYLGSEPEVVLTCKPSIVTSHWICSLQHSSLSPCDDLSHHPPFFLLLLLGILDFFPFKLIYPISIWTPKFLLP